MTSFEYWKEVKDTAFTIIETAKNDYECTTMEEIEEITNDTLLHETTDSHQWIIYYSYNLEILQHSGSKDYMLDNFGSEALAHALEEGGLNGLHQSLAAWAFYADVQEGIQEILESGEVE